MLSDARVLFVDPWSTTAFLFDPGPETFTTVELPTVLAAGAIAPIDGGRVPIVAGPDWETPGPRRDQPAPIVLDPRSTPS